MLNQFFVLIVAVAVAACTNSPDARKSGDFPCDDAEKSMPSVFVSSKDRARHQFELTAPEIGPNGFSYTGMAEGNTSVRVALTGARFGSANLTIRSEGHELLEIYPLACPAMTLFVYLSASEIHSAWAAS